MAIITGGKDTLGGQVPNGVNDSIWNQVEPLIVPEKLVRRFLFGIPLSSGIINPITKKPDVMTPDDLVDYIDRAVTEVDTLCHIDIMPTQIIEKHPMDPQEFKSLGYLRLRHRPIASIQAVQMVTSNDDVIFNFDMTWIERGQLHAGQLNLLPLLLMMGNNGSGTNALAGAATSSTYLSLFGGHQWVPSLMQIKYTTGWVDGLVPKIVNDLIGMTAAISILSMLAATYGRANSASLSMDGLSQSVGNSGPEIFTKRVNDLEGMQAVLVKKIKSYVGQTWFTGNV